jgi:hypothetical protein
MDCGEGNVSAAPIDPKLKLAKTGIASAGSAVGSAKSVKDGRLTCADAFDPELNACC